MKAIIRCLLKWLFRFRAEGLEALSTPGPVLLVPNHVSWIDWLFIGAVLEEDWRFVVSETVAEKSWFHRKVMKNSRTFPIDTNSPYSLRKMSEYLSGGGRLVLFAEGRISDTGELMRLFDGVGFLMLRNKAKVITAYLRGANRLELSRNPGWRNWFHPVSLHVGKALTGPEYEGLSMTRARARITEWLRDRMIEQQFGIEMKLGPKTILDGVMETALIRPKDIALEDIERKPLTYRRVMIGAEVLAGKLEEMLDPDAERVGVLMPNVNATPVLLMSLWALGRTPAMLNFSTGPQVMLQCSELAGLKQIITSKVFVEKAKLDLKPLEEAGIRIVLMESIRGMVTGWDKVMALMGNRLSPDGLSWKFLPPGKSRSAEDTAVVLFTSGSEGVPKGVKLSHRNIMANVRQMLGAMDLEDSDRIFNALPLFHCFGLTVETFLGLVRGLYVFLYPSPLHYRIVPTAIYDRECTIFLGTNTFLNGYARKAHPYDFRTVRYLFSAAEKLQESTSLTWSQKYGVRILEGYGATECSPAVSINSPLNPRYGSVGKLVPGMEGRVEEVPGVENGGRLFVKGPNLMQGYLNEDANEKFLAMDGWYDTGDIVEIDEEGYLFIRGRMKRFAKISGEMVSLTAVEDALAGAFPKYGMRHEVAVIAIPDKDKGERLIAISNDERLELGEIREVIKEKGLPNLFVPREVRYLREIPKLGTGKVNHRELAAKLELG